MAREEVLSWKGSATTMTNMIKHIINYKYEWRTKLRTTRNGHGQSGWSPIGCEGLYLFRTNLHIPCPLPTTWQPKDGQDWRSSISWDSGMLQGMKPTAVYWTSFLQWEILLFSYLQLNVAPCFKLASHHILSTYYHIIQDTPASPSSPRY